MTIVSTDTGKFISVPDSTDDAKQCAARMADIKRFTPSGRFLDALLEMTPSTCTDASRAELKSLMGVLAPGVVSEMIRNCVNTYKHPYGALVGLVMMASCSDKHKTQLRGLLEDLITTPQLVTDFMDIYWEDDMCPISNQVKKGLKKVFERFSYEEVVEHLDMNRYNAEPLREVLTRVHAKVSPDVMDLYDGRCVLM